MIAQKRHFCSVYKVKTKNQNPQIFIKEISFYNIQIYLLKTYIKKKTLNKITKEEKTQNYL